MDRNAPPNTAVAFAWIVWAWMIASIVILALVAWLGPVVPTVDLETLDEWTVRTSAIASALSAAWGLGAYWVILDATRRGTLSPRGWAGAFWVAALGYAWVHVHFAGVIGLVLCSSGSPRVGVGLLYGSWALVLCLRPPRSSASSDRAARGGPYRAPATVKTPA